MSQQGKISRILPECTERCEGKLLPQKKQKLIRFFCQQAALQDVLKEVQGEGNDDAGQGQPSGRRKREGETEDRKMGQKLISTTLKKNKKKQNLFKKIKIIIKLFDCVCLLHILAGVIR